MKEPEEKDKKEIEETKKTAPKLSGTRIFLT